MNKSKQSILNALSALALTVVTGIFGIYVTKLIIMEYGSDFNGLNSTANQFVNMLLVMEGGFTIAINVALFKPLSINDHKGINRILSATKVIFNKIGLAFLITSTLSSIIYVYFLSSDIPQEISFLIFFMAVFGSAFSLGYSTKYKVLIQSDNREYILNNIQLFTLILSRIAMLYFVFNNGHMLTIRLSVMIGTILNSILIGYLAEKNYKYLNFDEQPDYESIKGTKDVFVQKITSMIYSTLPILYISGTVGTVYTSIYVVYNNVFSIIKSIIYSFVNAPTMGFGTILAEKNNKKVIDVFLLYEFIVIYILFALLTTTGVLIMPFIKLYTSGITDADYFNFSIALLLLAIAFFEVIHIPSGNIINMSGNFKVGRNIQIIGSISLIILMLIGNKLFGVYGILSAVLTTSIIIGVLEVVYVHEKYFSHLLKSFLKLLIPNLLIMIPVGIAEYKLLPTINSYLSFFIWGFLIVMVNALILLIVNYIFNKKNTVSSIDRVKSLLIR